MKVSWKFLHHLSKGNKELRSLFKMELCPICESAQKIVLCSTCAKNTTHCIQFRAPARYNGEKRVWNEYSQLTAEVNPAVNLGMGFPDYLGPDHLRKALSKVASNDDPLLHQYPRANGHLRLVENLSKMYSPLIDRELNPETEIITGCGAYEILSCAIMGLVDDGDEVIVIEPFFDCYELLIKCAGGTPKFIALKPKRTNSESMTSADWTLDEKELTALFNGSTKMLILNSPNNPLGKVYTKEEMEMIAKLCIEFNVVCLFDEVYEWLVYEPNEHIRMATIPDMWERTISVGSAGKSFLMTGWRVGWAYAPAHLIRNLQLAHEACTYCGCTPVQEAIARALEYEIARRETPQFYFKTVAKDLLPKRDNLVQILAENGFNPIVPEGGFFILADWTDVGKKLDLSEENDKYKDYKFTKKFAKDVSILAMPATPFFSEEHKALGENYARFCFSKKDENIQQTGTLLKEWNDKRSPVRKN